ncbi:MAG TPA: tetratricopeptide repeat protein, partial [Blastocatellia bacterium]|nr:tetratricopeptide repeat protein [Blastocatellia bacterium]
LMIFALRMVCGASFKHAAVVVGLAWISLRFDSWLFSIATFSPFFTLIWGLPLALGAVYGVRAAHVQRQSFRRSLESCTINERDAEAHYQLGLIYQQRRQFSEAAARFKRAVEIDSKEPDANFELGRIARQDGRLQDAINHFNAVVAHSDKFRQSEVWREIGATYLAAGMHQEAHQALEKYVDRRPYDPEGLYHFGETLRNLGEAQRAQEMYKQCIQAVKTMPYYRRNEVSKWSRLAQAKLT